MQTTPPRLHNLCWAQASLNRACTGSGKEKIASIADSTVLIKVGIGVPRPDWFAEMRGHSCHGEKPASFHLYFSVPGQDGQVDAKERFRVVLYIIWWSEVLGRLDSSSKIPG